MGLISEPGSAVRKELEAVSVIASCLITDETPKRPPIMVAGVGPHLRIYCLYDEDALSGEEADDRGCARFRRGRARGVAPGRGTRRRSW